MNNKVSSSPTLAKLHEEMGRRLKEQEDQRNNSVRTEIKFTPGGPRPTTEIDLAIMKEYKEGRYSGD